MPRKPLSSEDWALRARGAVERCKDIAIRHERLLEDLERYDVKFKEFAKQVAYMKGWRASLARRAKTVKVDLLVLKSRFAMLNEKLEIGAALIGTYEDLDAIDKVLKRRKTKLRVRRHRRTLRRKKEAADAMQSMRAS
jgi:hypothetical protein